MAIIEIGGMMMELTSERQRRIAEALAETRRHLDRELAYSPDLRDNELIKFYRNHVTKLMGWLQIAQAEARDNALPVQHTRDRSNLLKD